MTNHPIAGTESGTYQNPCVHSGTHGFIYKPRTSALRVNTFEHKIHRQHTPAIRSEVVMRGREVQP